MRMSSCSLLVSFGAGGAAPVRRATGLAALLGATALAGCATPSLEGVETAQTGRDGRPLPLDSGAGRATPASSSSLRSASRPIRTPRARRAGRRSPGSRGSTARSAGRTREGVSCQLSIFYKVTDGADTAAEFRWGSRRHAAGAVLRYSNIDRLAPIGATTTARGTSAAPTAPVVVTTRANSRVLRLAVVETDDARNFLIGSEVFTDAPNTVRFNVASFSRPPRTAGADPRWRTAAPPTTPWPWPGSDNRNGAPGGSGTADWEILGRRPVAGRLHRDQAG